ncbi:hypothetical protein ACFVTC_21445 [Streptomyces sp. NPDC057950]|uniref:hypothetical protein n=1 Tax=Streptomyces sp. NPDC057950 TaxID=3346288 RepID=UPI0036EB99FC
MEQPRSAADRGTPAVVGVSAPPAGALPVATDGSAAAHPPTRWPVVRPDGAPRDRPAPPGPRERDRRSTVVLAGSLIGPLTDRPVAGLAAEEEVAGHGHQHSENRAVAERRAVGHRRGQGLHAGEGLRQTAAASRPVTLPCVTRFRDSARARPPPPVPDTAPATVPPAVDALTAEAEAAVTPYRLVTRVPVGARTHRSPHVR